MQVLAVCILYVRCAGCDPADPGVHQTKRAARAKQREVLKSMDLISLSNLDTPLEHSHDVSERNSASRKTPSPSICSRWLLCLPFAYCKKDDSTKLNVGELLLYCSICEAKVRHMLCLWWTDYFVKKFSGVILCLIQALVIERACNKCPRN